MNTTFQTTAVIRQRGQLTIPNKIREMLSWAKENTTVILEATVNNMIIVKPYGFTHSDAAQKWQKAWDAIQLARSFKGKKGNLSQFVAQDRETH